QMHIAAARVENSARVGCRHQSRGLLAEQFIAALPFAFTSAQQRVFNEVKHDLQVASPMNRLLQGDVGSGKTVVAIAAMLLAVESGLQAALMAPTQILAEQHYTVLRSWLDSLGIRIALRTGARQEDNTPLPLFARAESESLGSAGCQPAVSGSLPDTTSSRISDPRYYHRRLPHFERPCAKYAITFNTRSRRTLSERARDVVLESIRRWDGRRYELFAACVMPDHVHLLIEPMVERQNESGNSVFFSLSKILHSIKCFTANRINKIEKVNEPVWESESFDRMIRSESDLQEKFEYIMRNPWDAGIAKPTDDYPWVWYPRSKPEEFAASCRERQAGSLRSPTEEAGNKNAPQIIVGTHALLYDNVSFTNLGLAVIDEQHKFGVAQRAKLTSREPAPDVLVMTATPIPRTLTMTIYGDLEISTIEEMPRGRGKIVTHLITSDKLGEMIAFLREQLSDGRQAYIVYPLIDESEKLEAKAAAKEFEIWQERLRPFRCELLHGRISSPDKQSIMQRFRAGETQALISTTVIEVGVDI